jgi:hypothetical protein
MPLVRLAERKRERERERKSIKNIKIIITAPWF